MTIIKASRPASGERVLRRNPFGLHRDLNEFFDGFFAENQQKEVSFLPAVNIGENGDSFFLEISAPGYKREDMKISVENNVLTIEAEFKEEHEKEEKTYSRKEFSYGTFRRSFTLPESVDSDAINSKYQDGILKVNLPKRPEAKARPARTVEIG